MENARMEYAIKSSLIRFFVISMGLISQQSFANHVLPVYTGKFIGVYPDKVHQDSCGATIIDYTGTTNDYMGILKKQFDETPRRYTYINFCDWESRKFNLDTRPPVEFVVSENEKDWFEILKDPNAVHTIRMNYSCHDKFNKTLSMQVYAYPVYECPRGSRMTYESGVGHFVCSTTPNFCVADKWNTLIDKKEFPGANQQEIDKFFYDFVQNNTVSRQEKMAFLMKKISEFKSTIQYSYLMQLLGFLKPYEYIPDLIGKYKSESDISKKDEIISTIHDALLIKQEKPELASNQNIIDGENFILNLLKTEKNPQLLSHAIRGAYIATTRDNYIVVTEAIRRLNALSDKIYYFTLKQQDINTLKLFFDSKDIQRWQFEKWLSNQTTLDEKLNAYESLTFLIKQGVRPQDIDESVKAPLKAFIMKNKTLVSHDTIFDEAENEAKYQYAMATLVSSSSNERDAYLLKLIREEKDDLMQAKYLYGIRHLVNNNDIINKLTDDECKKLMYKFHQLFGDVENSNQRRLYASIDDVLTAYKK